MKNTNSFAVKLSTYTDLVNNPTADPIDYEKALYTLGRACASSVIKKVLDPKVVKTTESGKKVIKGTVDKKTGTETPTNSGFNPALMLMQADISRAEKALDRLSYSENNAFELVYDSNGELKQETVDPVLAQASATVIHENLFDGLDLVHDAIIAILDETKKQKERDPDMPTDLERPYTVKRLKSRVWIKESDSIKGMETVETSPIKEVYKHIRRSIVNSRAVQTDPRNGYTYLEDLVYPDGDESDPTVIYRRLPKYADLGGAACDYNGAETFYTVDGETVDRYYETVAELNLTDRQKQVLTYRMQGYGYMAIGTKLGVTQNAVYNTLKKIQAKAEKIGFTPSMWDEMTAKNN